VKVRRLFSDDPVVCSLRSTKAHRGRTAAIGCVNDGNSRNGHRRKKAFSSGKGIKYYTQQKTIYVPRHTAVSNIRTWTIPSEGANETRRKNTT